MTDETAFTRWLAAYGAALGSCDWETCGKLFTGDAMFLPTPFDKPVRGGAAIAGYLQDFWSRFDRISFFSDVIAPGWAHWHAAGGLDPLEESVQFDGILNAEFGPHGLCTQLRLWTVTLSPRESDMLSQRDA